MNLKRWRGVVARVAGGLFGLLVLLLVVLEDGRFLLRAGWEEARILVRRRPIESLVQDSSLPPVVRGKLGLVLDARRYAVQVLGLEAGRSFLYYSDVGRDTLVLVLSAAYRDRLEPYRWWFPVVGRVPYRGYFDWGAARRAEERLRRRGFDTYLRPTAAFSTLGWFDDPLLSTTLAEDSVGLANTVIHELVHNTVFVRDVVEFNESLASFVGARGAVAFFRERGDSVAAARAEAEWGDERRLAAFWDALAFAVEGAYRRAGSDSAARVAARDSVYSAWRRVLVDSVGPTLRFVPRAWLERVPLDNASLLARRTYATRVDLFEVVWERCGRDVAAVVRLARSVGEGDPYAVLAGSAAACAATR
jgi:predicted aminopeptidase